jgi:hypothetical protein
VTGAFYHIAIAAVDGRGGECSGRKIVSVPHDQGAGATDGRLRSRRRLVRRAVCPVNTCDTLLKRPTDGG